MASGRGTGNEESAPKRASVFSRLGTKGGSGGGNVGANNKSAGAGASGAAANAGSNGSGASLSGSGSSKKRESSSGGPGKEGNQSDFGRDAIYNFRTFLKDWGARMNLFCVFQKWSNF